MSGRACRMPLAWQTSSGARPTSAAATSSQSLTSQRTILTTEAALALSLCCPSGAGGGSPVVRRAVRAGEGAARPLRLRRMSSVAPRAASHAATSRPSPPKPPLTTAQLITGSRLSQACRKDHIAAQVKAMACLHNHPPLQAATEAGPLHCVYHGNMACCSPRQAVQ